MSFYTVIKTEITDKKYLIAALEEMKNMGEITSCVINEKKERIEIEQDGVDVVVAKSKSGNFYELSGDNMVVRPLTNRLRQQYALAAIKDNIPLDFEIAKEQELGGEITIVLKG